MNDTPDHGAGHGLHRRTGHRLCRQPIRARNIGGTRTAGARLGTYRPAARRRRSTTTAGRRTIATTDHAAAEKVGEYRIYGDKHFNGTVFERTIRGLCLKVKPPKNSPIRTGPILDLFRLLTKEAKERGATALHITGKFIANRNVMKLQGFIERVMGGRAVVLHDANGG